MSCYCETCAWPTTRDLCDRCAAVEARDADGVETCRFCGARHAGYFGDECESCFVVQSFSPRKRYVVHSWAQPMLVGGLLVRVESDDGFVTGGALLDRDRTVPLALVEVMALSACAGWREVEAACA